MSPKELPSVVSASEWPGDKYTLYFIKLDDPLIVTYVTPTHDSIHLHAWPDIHLDTSETDVIKIMKDIHDYILLKLLTKSKPPIPKLNFNKWSYSFGESRKLPDHLYFDDLIYKHGNIGWEKGILRLAKPRSLWTINTEQQAVRILSWIDDDAENLNKSELVTLGSEVSNYYLEYRRRFECLANGEPEEGSD